MISTILNAKLRIVSLAPSATSILFAIGAQKALVGVSRWCADVAPVGALPKLGDCWRLEAMQEILALRPTLVIGSVPYKQETVARFLEQPFSFLAMNPRTLADVAADIRLLGGISGRSAAASRVVARMEREFAALRQKSRRGKPHLRVYCEAWPNPRISSPPWVAELVEIAGGEMAVPAGGKVSDAQVAEARPDIVVLAWTATGDRADPKKSYALAAWRDVPAVVNRRVHVLRDELLNTPGPPLILGARELFRVIHGTGKGNT